MARKGIEQRKQQLVSILNEEDAATRLESLQELAKQVGASTTRIVTPHTGSGMRDAMMASNEITETEIVQNIEVALQTATMIDMCKTANRNFVIALIATIIALGSAIALWVAVCK